MDILSVEGGRKLQGEIIIEGAKNALLPLMCASLLTEETLNLSNAPFLADTQTLMALLENMGALVSYDMSKRALKLQTSSLTTLHAPYERVRKMRASILVLGPLLSRFGQAEVSLPGDAVLVLGRSIFI